jgi:hypothetical protein
MYEDNWIDVFVPKITHLLRFYIKIKVPDIEDGMWIPKNFKFLLLTKIVIKSMKYGRQSVLIEEIIDADIRDAADDYGTSRCNLINADVPNYTNKSFSYYTPLFPFRDILENLINKIVQITQEEDLEVIVSFKTIKDVYALISLNEDCKKVIVEQPICIQLEILDTEDDVPRTSIYLNVN